MRIIRKTLSLLAAASLLLPGPGAVASSIYVDEDDPDLTIEEVIEEQTEEKREVLADHHLHRRFHDRRGQPEAHEYIRGRAGGPGWEYQFHHAEYAFHPDG